MIVYKNFPKFPGKSKKFPGTNGNEKFREINLDEFSGA